MANEQQIDYLIVVADMEAKRDALNLAISGMRQWLSLGGPEEGPTGQPPSGDSSLTRESKPDLPTKIEFDTFFSLSIPEAIKKYLAMMKRPQTVADITRALETGGLSTTAANLMGTVTATLTRMKQTSGDVVAVRRGEWGLTEWYKGRRFDRPEPTKKPKKTAAKSRKAKPSSEKKNAPIASQKQEPEKKPSAPTPEQIEHVRALHAEGKGYAEIAKLVGLHSHLDAYRIIAKSEPNAEKSAASA